MYFERPFVRAYVDETGDRGLSPRASRYFGMLRAALEADEYGGFEEHHLTAVWHQIRTPGGFECIVLPGTMGAYPWWPIGG